MWWFNHLSNISSEAINKQPHASKNGWPLLRLMGCLFPPCPCILIVRGLTLPSGLLSVFDQLPSCFGVGIMLFHSRHGKVLGKVSLSYGTMPCFLMRTRHASPGCPPWDIYIFIAPWSQGFVFPGQGEQAVRRSSAVTGLYHTAAIKINCCWYSPASNRCRLALGSKPSSVIHHTPPLQTHAPF